MNKVCFGCGVKLQTEDKDALGYVPMSKVNEAKYCMRCFRMMHYGEVKSTETPKEAKEIINKINKDVRFCIFLVDFINLNESVISLFKSIKKEKILVVNKCELLPKHIKQERIVDFIRNYYKINDPIKLKGGKNHHGAKSILHYLEKERIHEAYILGISNSGKSTLINDLLAVESSSAAKINVNKKANTTLDFLRVPINERLTLIDSPGVILENALMHDTTGKNIISYTMQMKAGETVSLFDDTYALKFSEASSITLFTNIEGNKVIKKKFKEMEFPYEIHLEDNQDIVLIGIGFITVKKACTVHLTINPEHLEIRDSLFGGYHE